jgi:hypothetical protein
MKGGASGGSLVTAIYFRALAAQCLKAGRDCSDLFAKEEFRRLATGFSAKADELDVLSKHPEHAARVWRPQQHTQSGDH